MIIKKNKLSTRPENWKKKTHAQKKNTCWTKNPKKRVRLTKSEKKSAAARNDTEKSVWREKKEYKNISYTSTWSAILCECSWHHSHTNTHAAASTTPNKWEKTTIHRNHFVERRWIHFEWMFKLRKKTRERNVCPLITINGWFINKNAIDLWKRQNRKIELIRQMKMCVYN